MDLSIAGLTERHAIIKAWKGEGGRVSGNGRKHAVDKQAVDKEKPAFHAGNSYKSACSGRANPLIAGMAVIS